MAEVPFRPTRQLSEHKGKGASASREVSSEKLYLFVFYYLLPLTEVSCLSVTGDQVLFVAGVGDRGWVTGNVDRVGVLPQWGPVFHAFAYMKWEHKNCYSLSFHLLAIIAWMEQALKELQHT